MPVCAHCGATLAPAVVSHGYDVVLEPIDPTKLVEVVTALRSVLGYGFADAKEAIDGAPYRLRCGQTPAGAAKLRDQLQATGVTVRLAPCPGAH